MNWLESVNEGLPPPRDDEPAKLRSDIVDELVDHLDCAMTHERRRTEDETAAQRNVLARFGDPAAIARRLWLDAMKETLMTQRITLAAVVVLTIAGITASFIAWRSMQLNRKLNEALLAQLTVMSNAPAQTSVPLSLTTLTVRLAEGSKGGNPVVGKEVTLQGRPFLNEEKTRQLKLLTNDAGLATFGPMNPGSYSIYLYGPSQFRVSETILLYAGQETTKDFVFPTESQLPGGEVDVSFKIRGPADVEMDRILIVSRFVPEWLHIEGTKWIRGSSHHVYLNSEGAIVPRDENFGPAHIPRRPGPSKLARTNDDFLTEPSVRIYAGPYKCERIDLLYPVSSPGSVAYTRSPTSSSRQIQFEFEKGSEPQFEAKSGDQNIWKIEIPEPSIEKLREVIAKADEKEN